MSAISERIYMPRTTGSIGTTKLKILAIICYCELSRIMPYGYNIWLALKDRFHLYLEREDLRNVYRHLRDLSELGYIEKGTPRFTAGAPGRQPYSLTDKGRTLKDKFVKYLEILNTN